METQLLECVDVANLLEARELELIDIEVERWLGDNAVAGVAAVHLVKEALQEVHRRERVQRRLHTQIIFLGCDLVENFVEDFLRASRRLGAVEQARKLVVDVGRRARLLHAIR